MKKWLLKPPLYGDFLRLLQAWRVWAGGAVLGAVLAGVIFMVIPPPYRAHATVLVDHNAEQVIPLDNPDRQVFYYLQRETDKLIEIAWADNTLSDVSNQFGIPISVLRNERLHLSQSGDGGWHFFADAPESETASTIASAWANSFYTSVQAQGPGISPFLEIIPNQLEDLPVQRKVSLGVYVFSGALFGALLLAILLLFFDRKEA